ncbi:MAG TPA: class I SAM-dependent methyltransferase [bacterium]|nr:class I SAM-dependent methyltransferase [bacterium]
MNKVVSQMEFSTVYRRVVDKIAPFVTPEIQAELARHNAGWKTGMTDFVVYLRLSEKRYYKAYRALAAHTTARRVCDVGGFWGVFSLVLQELGYEVVMTEALKYYSNAFDDLFAAIRAGGVQIVDYDPFDERATPPADIDFVFLLAIIEHFPHSPLTFMHNVKRMLRPDGKIYVEVPNIAYWWKRWGLLRGETPLAPIEIVCESAVPFIGHHHEYTRVELETLANLCGMNIISRDDFNYSRQEGFAFYLFKGIPLEYIFEKLAYAFFKNSREVLTMVCELRR